MTTEITGSIPVCATNNQKSAATVMVAVSLTGVAEYRLQSGIR